MAEQWRILIVVDEETLNRSIVNSLRKDGYAVQGVLTGAEAIRILWSEECDVVIGDLRTPGADSFELLQWLRTYRPNTRMIMISSPGSPTARTRALESGAVSYLEKPLNFHLLKEELRRLLQQTGFSASLDSFDLLDVIQIITMSRKSIALLVNTGLEERGILRFQNGELIWAEYGMLRGEEAFFALAAHKNGTVIHQPWNEQITPNVTQPLSRLIFQALQYRTKYADMQQASGEYETMGYIPPVQSEEVDDNPFVVLEDNANPPTEPSANAGLLADVERAKEWWQQTGYVPRVKNTTGDMGKPTHSRHVPAADARPSVDNPIVPSTVRKTPASQRTDLPAWLTDQPTSPSIPAVHPPSFMKQVPATPVLKSSSAEWQPPRSRPLARATEQRPSKQADETNNGVPRRISSPEWQSAEIPVPPRSQSGSLKSLASIQKTGEALPESGPLSTEGVGATLPRSGKRNYPALVAALQTMGYSIPGFVAVGIVSINGHPIAQVAIDDLDIGPMCGSFSNILRTIMQSLDQGAWGGYEDTVITSAERHILLRFVGGVKDTFQVLITTHEADPIESLKVMANVESAISSAL